MNMIDHQAEVEDRHAKIFLKPSKQFEKIRPILVIAKDHDAVIAAANQVVGEFA
jgi:hypothetical protein